MEAPPVQFQNVSKRFRLGQTHDSLRGLLAGFAMRVLGRQHLPARREEFWAIDDVGFKVNRGEALGIIGPNGAGKSTALKLLAGILRPDRGTVCVRGRLAALIEVGAGFHGDLSGRENVFLNGSILGMSRREIKRKLDDIVAFAGIERFIDMPVKRYSSGMYARLGFSIAAHVAPDVLLVDEVLSVGDAVFRIRCLERMRELVRGGCTLVFVTHNLDQMLAICDRAIVLEKGRTVFAGSAEDAVAKYQQAMSRSYADLPLDLAGESSGNDSAVTLEDVTFLTSGNLPMTGLRARDALGVEVCYRMSRRIPRLVVELNLRAASGEHLLSINSGRDGVNVDGAIGSHRAILSLPSLPVRGGHYFWNVRMWDADRGTTLIDSAYRFPLVVSNTGPSTGTLSIEHSWAFVKERSRDVLAATVGQAPATSRDTGGQHERLSLR